ncbi:hypothetical protein [Iningainema tapete]|uniref:Uncharacterized protein n=1 Tax=Iningainema tapete BLCC-T55 TaxID=2748662 RepID=A0A8J6XHQ4_9CYAN|nr:hypothetical protein [Iningainema tapete]MBD2770871.1 hypothetical protein [Iningainema tapete BLCC-T55]
MNLPPQLQKEVEKWANLQGVSSEQFILQTVADKIDILNQQMPEVPKDAEISPALNTSTPEFPKVYRKEGILVIETEPIENLDINAFINEAREERIREQMAW